MALYRIRFMKLISDATGHEHRMCQSEFEVEAESQDAAIEEAKGRFSSGEQSGDWSLRADTIEAQEI
jgi:hypothetical protein